MTHEYSQGSNTEATKILSNAASLWQEMVISVVENGILVYLYTGFLPQSKGTNCISDWKLLARVFLSKLRQDPEYTRIGDIK